MTRPLNRYSRTLTQEPSQGASQAMLYATGLDDADLAKPEVGIASMWYEGNPCNLHLGELAAEVKQGVVSAGLVGMRFNTIGVSDGISMGTAGMSYSLPSRDLIADSLETVVAAHWYDALIALPGCDKNLPGSLMAMARLNRPALVIYGGTIRHGCSSGGQKLDVVSAFQAYGEFLAGKIDDAERRDILRNACPGPGACGGMYTANSMATAIEAMGMSLPGSSSTPAEAPEKLAECRAAGAAILRLLEQDIKPRDIMTRRAFENAMVITMVLGGSTNVVLHLIAVARAAEVDLTIEDFQKTSNRIPYLADLKPSGQFTMDDLHRVGGVPAVIRLLLERGVLDGDCLTVTGRTLAENVASFSDLEPGQTILAPWDQPHKATGHIRILRGSLAPGGAVAKITGKEGTRFSGPARVFDSEEDMLDAVRRGDELGGRVIVIRYEGPKGGPGMPEMLGPTSVIMGAGLGREVALVTDGRFSGGSHGFLVGHVVPEAQDGGPIALVENGDRVDIDSEANTIELAVSVAELDRRRARWVPKPLKATRGALHRYLRLVKSASEGCVTDE
jgi:dihydroxy-acid dehydratase